MDKKSILVTCRFCHSTGPEKDLFRGMVCGVCSRMEVYDWTSGSPVEKPAVRELTEKEQKAYLEDGITPDEVNGPIYKNRSGSLNLEDLYDDFILHYAGFDDWRKVPADRDIDRYVQTGTASPEIHAFLEKMVNGKRELISDQNEYKAMLVEEMMYEAFEEPKICM